MARDATNMPFERSTTYQNNDPTEQPLSGAGAFILAGVIFISAVLVHIFYYRKSLS